MKVKTIITGKRGSGKTSKALKMTAGHKAEWFTLEMLNSPFWAQNIDESTEFIIIDEIPSILDVPGFLLEDKLVISRPFSDRNVIQMPHVILVINESDQTPADHENR